ncbi:MAG: hypothetical protein WKG07_38845 [Hymenobacter sp.]
MPPDLFDPLKYVPLGRRPGYFLTVGLDVRYQYEVIKNDNWGAGAPPTPRPPMATSCSGTWCTPTGGWARTCACSARC